MRLDLPGTNRDTVGRDHANEPQVPGGA